MRRRTKILIVVAILLIALAIGGMLMISSMKKGLDELENISLAELDLSQIEDGTYKGDFQAGPIAVEVQVSIENNRISQVLLIKHDNGKGSAAEAIIDKVIDAQSLQVDAITGATYSSKAILKAIEDALTD